MHHLDDGLPVMRVGDVASDGLDPVPAVLRQLIEAVAAAGGRYDVGAGGMQYASESCP
jgi:hypothetical protein